MRVAAYTLGCKVNQYDTEAMLEQFERAGYESVPFSDEADVYIINTCTVTGTGDQKSLKTIRRALRERPCADVIVCGCLAQRDAARVTLPGVRLVLGNQRRSEAYALYERAVRENSVINAVGDLTRAVFEPLSVLRHEGKTRAVLKIQEGCDRYCAYCAIPYVRGPVRSMALDEVARQADTLAQAGYRELVLTGIHLASFGRGGEGTLWDAVRVCCGTEGLLRVRIGSLEPVCVTDEFARALASEVKIARQFHLSLQSGSDGVLKRMRRRYTAAEYLAACDTLRAHMPECAITTDVIAGFPGETDEEFAETCRFVEKARLAKLHVFPYSRRSGTLADKMPDQISEEIKKERAAILTKIGNRLEMSFVESFVGSERDVLFETEADGLCEGYTGEYVRVRAKAEKGEMRRVRISRAAGLTLLGDTV